PRNRSRERSCLIFLVRCMSLPVLASSLRTKSFTYFAWGPRRRCPLLAYRRHFVCTARVDIVAALITGTALTYWTSVQLDVLGRYNNAERHNACLFARICTCAVAPERA